MKQIKTNKKFQVRPNSPGNFSQKLQDNSPFRVQIPKYQQDEVYENGNSTSRDQSPRNLSFNNDLSQNSIYSPNTYRKKVFNFASRTSGWKQNGSQEKSKKQDPSLNKDMLQFIQDKFNSELSKCLNSSEKQGQQSIQTNKLQTSNSLGRNIYFHDYQAVTKLYPREELVLGKSQGKTPRQQNLLLEEEDYFSVKIRKSFRAAINHYCKNLEEELSKLDKEDLLMQEKKLSREYCFDLAMKIIHLFTTELTPFSTVFNLLSNYCKSMQFCNQRNILRLYDNIKNQLEYEEKMKNTTAEKQYELFLQLKKKEKLNQLKETQQKHSSFFDISLTLSSFIVEKCKDILINENRKRDKAFDNFKHLDSTLAQSVASGNLVSGRTGNIIIKKDNHADKHRYSFLFTVDRKSLSNQGGGIDIRNSIAKLQDANRKFSQSNLSVKGVTGGNEQTEFMENEQNEHKDSQNTIQDKDNLESEDDDDDDDEIDNNNPTLSNIEKLQEDGNYKKQTSSKLHIKRKGNKKKNKEIVEKFSQQKDEFVINQILQEKFDDKYKEEEKKEREREEQELEEKLKNAYDMNLQGMITDIIQSESENIHRALTDHIWQLIEIIKQRFYLDKSSSSSEHDNLDDLTAYVKETFVIKVEELQEKQINQLKQRFTFQIEVLQKKCRQLRIQFLQSQKIQQYLYESKTELYEYLKNLRNQIEDLRDKFIVIQSERDALELQIKDTQLSIRPNYNLYLKTTVLQAN